MNSQRYIPNKDLSVEQNIAAYIKQDAIEAKTCSSIANYLQKAEDIVAAIKWFEYGIEVKAQAYEYCCWNLAIHYIKKNENVELAIQLLQDSWLLWSDDSNKSKTAHRQDIIDKLNQLKPNHISARLALITICCQSITELSYYQQLEAELDDIIKTKIQNVEFLVAVAKTSKGVCINKLIQIYFALSPEVNKTPFKLQIDTLIAERNSPELTAEWQSKLDQALSPHDLRALANAAKNTEEKVAAAEAIKKLTEIGAYRRGYIYQRAKDDKQAAIEFESGAREGNPNCMFALAECLDRNNNLTDAANWYLESWRFFIGNVEKRKAIVSHLENQIQQGKHSLRFTLIEIYFHMILEGTPTLNWLPAIIAQLKALSDKPEFITSLFKTVDAFIMHVNKNQNGYDKAIMKDLNGLMEIVELKNEFLRGKVLDWYQFCYRMGDEVGALPATFKRLHQLAKPHVFSGDMGTVAHHAYNFICDTYTPTVMGIVLFKEDPTSAWPWLKMAYSNEQRDLLLAECYEKGIGTELDLAEATRLYVPVYLRTKADDKLQTLSTKLLSSPNAENAHIVLLNACSESKDTEYSMDFMIAKHLAALQKAELTTEQQSQFAKLYQRYMPRLENTFTQLRNSKTNFSGTDQFLENLADLYKLQDDSKAAARFYHRLFTSRFTVLDQQMQSIFTRLERAPVAKEAKVTVSSALFVRRAYLDVLCFKKLLTPEFFTQLPDVAKLSDPEDASYTLQITGAFNEVGNYMYYKSLIAQGYTKAVALEFKQKGDDSAGKNIGFAAHFYDCAIKIFAATAEPLLEAQCLFAKIRLGCKPDSQILARLQHLQKELLQRDAKLFFTFAQTALQLFSSQSEPETKNFLSLVIQQLSDLFVQQPATEILTLLVQGQDHIELDQSFIPVLNMARKNAEWLKILWPLIEKKGGIQAMDFEAIKLLFACPSAAEEKGHHINACCQVLQQIIFDSRCNKNVENIQLAALTLLSWPVKHSIRLLDEIIWKLRKWDKNNILETQLYVKIMTLPYIPLAVKIQFSRDGRDSFDKPQSYDHPLAQQILNLEKQITAKNGLVEILKTECKPDMLSTWQEAISLWINNFANPANIAELPKHERAQIFHSAQNNAFLKNALLEKWKTTPGLLADIFSRFALDVNADENYDEVFLGKMIVRMNLASSAERKEIENLYDAPFDKVKEDIFYRAFMNVEMIGTQRDKALLQQKQIRMQAISDNFVIFEAKEIKALQPFVDKNHILALVSAAQMQDVNEFARAVYCAKALAVAADAKAADQVQIPADIMSELRNKAQDIMQQFTLETPAQRFETGTGTFTIPKVANPEICDFIAKLSAMKAEDVLKLSCDDIIKQLRKQKPTQVLSHSTLMPARNDRIQKAQVIAELRR